LGQNLTQDDEDAIAAELESILVVRFTRYCRVLPKGWGVGGVGGENAEGTLQRMPFEGILRLLLLPPALPDEKVV